jgi:hypothetical protein
MLSINRRLGVYMRVHRLEIGRAELQLVHGGLHALLVDHMGRLENCGHAGVASEKNFCLYCKARHSCIAVPEGFDTEGKPYI